MAVRKGSNGSVVSRSEMKDEISLLREQAAQIHLNTMTLIEEKFGRTKDAISALGTEIKEQAQMTRAEVEENRNKHRRHEEISEATKAELSILRGRLYWTIGIIVGGWTVFEIVIRTIIGHP